MILLKGGTVLTMEDNNSFVGDVLVDGEKIKKVGKNITATKETQVIDVTGKYVLPGIIDGHCHIGLWEDGQNESEGDGNEMTEPVTPYLRSIDAINPFDKSFIEARENGITSVVTGPGSANVFGGQFVAMKTVGQCIDEMIIKAPIGSKAALGENPKRVYNEQQKAPSTRMATAALLRETLYDAKEYMKKLNEKDEDDKPDKDFKLDSLIPVLEKKIPLKIHVHRADDILTAIRIAKEFDIDFTLDHCTEGYMIPKYLKNSGAKGIFVGPLMCDRCKVELANLSMAAPCVLAENDIEFAIITDHPVIPIQYLMVEVALAVREGLDEMTALKSVTINPAKIIGIDNRVGSLKAGKDADIVVFSGHPLEFKTKAELVFVDGEKVFEKQN